MIFQAVTLILLFSVGFAFPSNISFSECWLPSRDNLGNLRLENEDELDWNTTVVPSGYLLEFNCEPGFVISGHRIISCIQGRWTANFPTCIELFCPPAPKIPNTRHIVRKGVSRAPNIGSRVFYRCVRGYKLAFKNVYSLKCALRGNKVEWNGSMPECVEEDSCPDPGVSNDGRREGTCCHIGVKLKFYCNRNYEIAGDEEIECLEGAIWSAPRPRCRPIDEEHCPDPPDIPNGSIVDVKGGDYYVFDDDAMVKCDPGYAPKSGSIVISCDDEGQWDATFAQCKEVSCERPPDLENGAIPQLEETNSTLFSYGFQLTPKCNSGFRLIGDSMRSCGNIGWTGKTPYCEVIRCYDPGYPEFGKREGHNFEIGSKVMFSCFAGYYLIGSKERYCLPNGQWSDELTKCDTKNNYCPDPGTPINGWKSGNRYDQDETVVYGCHAGFFLVGSQMRVCQENHTWTGIEPTCRGAHDFDNRADVAQKLILASQKKADEQVKVSEEYKQNLREVYATKYGLSGSFDEMDAEMSRSRTLDLNYPGRIILYFMFDSSGSIGNDDFRTSIDFAKALVRKVGISLNGARAGAMTFSSIANVEFLPMQYTTTEEVLGALDRIQKSSGGTATRKALKLVLQEMIPLSQGNFGKKGVKSVIFMITDGKANMAGDPEQQAKELQDAGVEIYCIGITGDINQKSLHKIASSPIDEHVFILKDYKILSWVVQSITKGTIDYSQCGEGLLRDPFQHPRVKRDGRGRIISGRKAVDPWPWMAALYINKKLQCGGSIIDKWWILTAAHCLVHKGEERDLNTVIVKLGLTDVSNSTYLQEFESERFVIHEDYHPVFLDYDIALIKLNKPIEYNAYVRPICLPPKVLPNPTTLYEHREIVYAVGWGYNKTKLPDEKIVVKPMKHLKELNLPIQLRERCQKSIENKNYIFTDRMFCAGSGLGDADTCEGDSGGPMMQSQMNEEGSVYYVQVGIVSWGDGCGMMNTYGFYTHIHNLREWIIQKTEIEK